MNSAQAEILKEQETCWGLKQQGYSRSQIEEATGLSSHQVKRRLAGAAKAARLDPDLKARLNAKGITDFAGLHSGWLLEKDESGSGSSLYFYLGPDEEKIDLVEAIKEVLSDIPRLEPIPRASTEGYGKDFANWLFLADLHVGGEYGSQIPTDEYKSAIDDLMSDIRPAEKAVLCELGDLLDANDHKGATPASGNPTDTIRDDHLGNTKRALWVMKYAAYRLLETHDEVEIHMVRGNHDETAYIAVLLALEEHFKDNPRLKIFVPSCPEEEEFRIITWGKCGFMPHHGDKAKPEVLKDVWSDQFPEEWNQTRMWRLIATGHYHTLKVQELVGAEHRQFGTIHRPNRWARLQGFFGRGRLSILRVHKEMGLKNETISNLQPMLRGKA